MPPHGPVAALEYSRVRAEGSAASRPSRSSARSYAPLTPPAAAVNSCRTRPAPAAGLHTPLVAPPACPSNAVAPSASSPECNCVHRTLSSSPPPHHCDIPCRHPSFRFQRRSPWFFLGAATSLRVPPALLPPSPLRPAFHPPSSCRPGRLLAASPPPPHPCPGLPRALPCGLDASVRPSSSRSVHPHPPGSSTLCWTISSFACDPIAPSLPASVPQSPMPSPIPAETPRSSLPCPVARSNASPRSPPMWSHRWRSASPSPTHHRPPHPAPSRRLRDAVPRRSNGGWAEPSLSPAVSPSTPSPQNAAPPPNPPIALP